MNIDVTDYNGRMPSQIRFSVINNDWLIHIASAGIVRVYSVSYDQWMEARRRAVFAICGYMAEEGMKE